MRENINRMGLKNLFKKKLKQYRKNRSLKEDKVIKNSNFKSVDEERDCEDIRNKMLLAIDCDDKNKETVAKSEEDVADSKEIVAESEENITDNEKNIIDSEETDAKGKESVTENKETTTESEKSVAESEEIVADNEEDVSNSEEIVLKNEEDITLSKEVVTKSEEDIIYSSDEHMQKKRRKRLAQNVSDKERKITNIVFRKLEYKPKKVKIVINPDKVYERMKEIAKSKQVRRALNISVVACSSVFTINVIDKINRKIVIDVNAQEVSWSMNKSLNSNNYEYELFRNGERLTTTRACKFVESISTDKESPAKINSIRLNKSDDMFTFTWKAPQDKGTELSYKVKAVNKSFGKAYTSRTLKTDIVTGIEKYIITLDGKKYESVTPNFNININSLKCGSHNLEVVAVDYAGNVSSPKNVEFKVDNTKFFIADYKLATNNPNITNEAYDIYLVKEYETEKDGKVVKEKKEVPISIGDNISSYFRSEKVPPISNPRYICEDDLVNVTWEENTFGTNNTEFYIECKSKKGIKSYKSEKMKYTSGDFLPGYYYQVNKDPLYTVKQTDLYTMDNNVTLDYNRFDRSKIYYFHVASANEFGNLSKTKTLELDLKNFTSVGEQKDSVREILYRTKGLDSDIYRKITDDLYNTFTHNTIKKLKEIGLKIVVMQEDITGYVLSNHNTKVTNKDICYIEGDSTIVYNAKSSLELLIKEIVGVLDNVKENPLSKNIDFLTIYNQEKANIKEGKLTAQEYLAEAVFMYMSDSHLLKSTSPKTYEFVKSRYKTIMFA